MKALFSLFAFFLFISSQAHAQQFYEANEVGSELKLPNDLTKPWLDAFKNKQNFILKEPQNKTQFSKFEELLKQIEADYLYLRLDQLDPKIKEASQLLQNFWPFTQQASFYKKLLSIELMAYQTKHQETPFEATVDVIERSLALSEDPEFLAMLPQGVRQKLSSLQAQSFEIKEGILEDKPDALFESGVKRRLPARLPQGKHFVHLRKGVVLTAAWILIDPSQPEKIISLRPIWSRSYFENQNEQSWLSTLKSSIPSNYRNSKLLFYPSTKKEKSSAVKLFPQAQIKNQKQNTAATSKQNNLNSKLDPIGLEKELDKLDPMDDFSDSKLKVDEHSILTNPWFWIGVGVIAGGTGYLIYDANQSKSVTTP